MEPESHLSLLGLIPASDQITQFPFMIAGLCLLILLLLFSSILTGFESACVAIRMEEKNSLEAMQKNNSQKVLQILSDPEKLIATTIIGTSLLNLIVILLAVFLLNQLPAFSAVSLSGTLLELLVISMAVIIFGKILPKIYAYKNALQFSLLTVYPVIILQTLLFPLVFLLLRFNSLIKYSIIPNHNNLSIDGLSEALDKSKDVVTEDRKILMGIMNFSNIEVNDIMKPRMDVVSADTDTSFTELIQVINESGFSRIPVFTETFDNISGILYVKDLLPFLAEQEKFRWQELIRPAYFVPETKKIKDLLQEFLDKKIHMAIVVDEYGGTEGIVTLEDILEEIVGEITDESDEVESFYSRIDDFNYIFDGKILLNDFFKIVQLSEELFEPIRGDADTLAGLILEIKGEIPPVNETVLLKNFSFTILSVDERRIKKLKFTMDKNLKTR